MNEVNILCSNDEDVIDRAIAAAAVAGDKEALEELVRRIQGFIFSLALRMLGSTDDAEDATQEILLRLITNLGSYRQEAALRTWAYRVAIRHLMAFKSRRGAREHTFSQHGQALDRSLDEDIADESSLPADQQLMIEEVKSTCLSGLLLCLDREHRLVFVLGEIFEAPDVVSAELLGISRENVRQRLSRARQQLRSFLEGRCGLVDQKNPCRCARKTRSLIAQGFVDPAAMQFASWRIREIAAQAADRSQALESLAEETFARLLRSQNIDTPRDYSGLLRDCLEDGELGRVLELDN
jgi:RNA polymerase sigma factor (sigma-70 family)